MSESGSSYVPSISLDEWRAERGVNPSLIKIDTQGAEVVIFRGAEWRNKNWLLVPQAALGSGVDIPWRVHA